MKKLIEYLSNNSITILLFILNLIFGIYFIVLAYYSRPHYDDLHFMWATREYGILGFVDYVYNIASGRFIMYLIVGTFAKLQYIFDNNLLIPIIYALIGFGFTFHVVKNVLRNSNFLILNSVILFYCIYIITSIDFAVFNWYAGSIYYIIGPLILYFFYLINFKHHSYKTYIQLFILSVIIGGIQEAYTAIFISMIFVNIILYALKLRKFNLKHSQIRLLSLCLIVTSIIFLIVIIAPGNYVRMNMPEFKVHLTVYQFFIEIIKSISLFFYFSSFNFAYYFTIALLSFIVGNKYNNKISSNITQKILVSLSVYMLFLIFTVIPVVYLFGNFGVQRHYILTTFTTMILLGYISFILGNYFTLKIEFILKVILFVSILFLGFIMLNNLKTDGKSAKSYAEEVDTRIVYLKTLNKNGQKGLVRINKIQNIPYTIDSKYWILNKVGKKNNNKPLLYYCSDVSKDVVDYSINLQKVYKFNFEVIEK